MVVVLLLLRPAPSSFLLLLPAPLSPGPCSFLLPSSIATPPQPCPMPSCMISCVCSFTAAAGGAAPDLHVAPIHSTRPAASCPMPPPPPPPSCHQQQVVRHTLDAFMQSADSDVAAHHVPSPGGWLCGFGCLAVRVGLLASRPHRQRWRGGAREVVVYAMCACVHARAARELRGAPDRTAAAQNQSYRQFRACCASLRWHCWLLLRRWHSPPPPRSPHPFVFVSGTVPLACPLAASLPTVPGSGAPPPPPPGPCCAPDARGCGQKGGSEGLEGAPAAAAAAAPFAVLCSPLTCTLPPPPPPACPLTCPPARPPARPHAPPPLLVSQTSGRQASPSTGSTWHATSTAASPTSTTRRCPCRTTHT